MDVAKIKQLRELTQAGIADCRKALQESGNDLAKAQIWLKKQGIAKAANKQKRQTTQGIISSYIHQGGRIGVLVELACETDFVARTDEFQALGRELAMQVSAMQPKNVQALLKQAYIRDASLTIADLVKSHIAKLGENIQVVRFSRFEVGE